MPHLRGLQSIIAIEKETIPILGGPQVQLTVCVCVCDGLSPLAVLDSTVRRFTVTSEYVRPLEEAMET